jgi:hypothetical protein
VCAEAAGERARDGGRPDVVGDVALELTRRQAQIAVIRRHCVGCVIAEDEDPRLRSTLERLDGMRLDGTAGGLRDSGRGHNGRERRYGARVDDRGLNLP